MLSQRKAELKKLLKERFKLPPDFLRRAGFTHSYANLVIEFLEFENSLDRDELFWFRDIYAYMLFLRGKFKNAAPILENLLRHTPKNDVDKIKLLKFNLALIYFQWSAELRYKRGVEKREKMSPKENETRQEAEYIFKELLNLTKDDNNQLMIRILIGFAFFLAWKEEHGEAIKTFEKAFALSKDRHLLWEEARCYDGIGVVYKMRSDFGRGLDYFDKALKIFSRVNDAGGIIESKHNIALTSWDKDQKNHEEIKRVLESRFHYLITHGDPRVAAIICRNIRRVSRESGERGKEREYTSKERGLRDEFELE